MMRTIKKSLFMNVLGDKMAKSTKDLPDRLSLSIDSRTLNPGDIFFAIKGELADGHDHIFEAYKKGAALVVAERREEPSNNVPAIIVEDSLKSFSLLAREHLRSLDVIKIAITGSNGKTTTKEMVKAALSHIFGASQVYASEGNKNNHFGIPLSALEVLPSHRVAIFEMGMNHALEIASHCFIIEPGFGIITNISFAHEGNFADGIEGVARAKGELFDFLARSGGTVIVNIDDARVMALRDKLGLNSLTFGIDAKADIRIMGPLKPYCLEDRAQEVGIRYRGEDFSCEVPLLGHHHAQNAACALAMASALNLDIKKASVGIKSMDRIKGRMSISHSPRGYLLVNDGYNANPSSMKAGILATLELKAVRRIAVIGAMGELGEKSATHHYALGGLLAEHFDQLFICGKEAVNTVAGAKGAGFPEQKIFYARTSLELIEPLKNYLAEGDLIFIKGSLSANMKAIADSLADH